MQIRNFPRATLFNIRRSMKGETPVLPPLPPRKPYNHLRGMTVNVAGEVKGRGPFINIGGRGVFVAPENIESIDPPSEGVPCVGCGLVTKITGEKELVGAHAENVNSKRPYVEQNTYWVGRAYPGAVTSGIATCAALQVEVGGFQFLAHISAETDMAEMEVVLQTMLSRAKGKPSITIWSGTGVRANDPVHFENPSDVAVGKIKTLLTKIGIRPEDVTEYPVCYAASVPL
jgi:hypothetical protein